MPEYCYHCMRELQAGATRCPRCGEDPRPTSKPHQLAPGTVLQGRYLLGRVLGQGGFGITYIGLDTLLGSRVAVKEFYPSGFANRLASSSSTVAFTDSNSLGDVAQSKERFLHEARVIARLDETGGVVDIKNYFEENGTAYIVMEYLEGEDLQQYLEHASPSADEVFGRFAPVMDALASVHAHGIIHRDISPGNIKVLSDGSLRLMDFGAARPVVLDGTRSVSVMLKPGYSPEEQYRPKGKLGPWTDIYALGATMYKCITGVTPDDSLQRLCAPEDTIVWPSQLEIEISPLQEAALEKAMAIRARDRFQSIGEMQAFLRGEDTPLRVGNEDAPEASSGQSEGALVTYMPDRSDGRQRRPRGRRIGIAAGIAAVAVLGIGGTALALQGGTGQAVAHARPEVTVADYEGTYDGKPHSATVELGDGSNAELYYSEQPLSFENYRSAVESGTASSAPIERTDAGQTTVYYLAISAPVDSSGARAEATAEDCATGSATVRIAKAKQKVKLPKKSFSKTTTSGAFKLGAKAKGKLSYKSSRTGVAKVGEAGTVTVSGAGTAKITVTAAATKNYRSAKASVTVKVAQATAPTYQDTNSDGATDMDSGNYGSGSSSNTGSTGSSSHGSSGGSSSLSSKDNATDSVEIDGWV